MLSFYMPSMSNPQTAPCSMKQANDNPRLDDAALLLSLQQLFALPQSASILRFPCLQDRRFDEEPLLQFLLTNLLTLRRWVPSSESDGRVENVNVRNVELTKFVGLRIRQALIV